MKLAWKIKTLYLKETFSIAYGNYNYRRSLLVSIAENEKIGYGECVEINYYGIDLNEFEKKLDQIKVEIESFSFRHPKAFYQYLLQLNLHPFLRSALDCAYWDFYGKSENKSFAEINSINTIHLPESSYTISIAPIEQQLEKIENSQWKMFKVKCNGLDRENIFRLLDSGRAIALDSNSSFSNSDCEFLQNNPLTQNFLYLEQPRPMGEFRILDPDKFAIWMADEDCQDLSYLEKLKNNYSAINIKLMKCGGISPALELIDAAKKLDYKVMIGCMTESTVGISAGIAVAALCDFADLDGANLISNDFASGSFVKDGQLMLSPKPGLGIHLNS